MGNTLFIKNDWKGGIGKLSVSPNGRYLIDDYANPIFLQGDAAWSLIAQLGQADAFTYLEDRAARGFNVVLVNLIEHYFADNAPNNDDDVAPFTGANFTTPNSTYFTHADAIINKAWSLGIYVLLAPLYLGFVTTDQGWDTEVAAASTADMESWGDYCGDRYKDYDNIIWVMGGDRDPTSFLTKINAFVSSLQAAGATQLITVHDAPGSKASSNVSESWLTLNNTYETYPDEPTWAQSAYTEGDVFFMIEGWYENEHSMSNVALRSQAYWTVLNGAIGHVFGSCPIWHFNATTGAGFCDSAYTWSNRLGSDGSVSMTHFGNLFRSLAWHTLVPDTAHDLLTSGYGTIESADYAPAAINAAGTLAVIYMPSNRTMTVDMTEFAGTVTARWYDPTDGSYTADAASPLANTGTHNFSRATANSDGAADWVLVLEA